MQIKFNRPTIYCSHSIRGDGTKTIKENCRIACRAADKIERVFPEISIYCPARHDLSLQILWDAEKVSVDDIMFADLEILRNCHGWMWYWTSESKGCELEREEAQMAGLTSQMWGRNEIITTDLLKANYDVVRKVIGPIVEAAKTRFLERKQ